MTHSSRYSLPVSRASIFPPEFSARRKSMPPVEKPTILFCPPPELVDHARSSQIGGSVFITSDPKTLVNMAGMLGAVGKKPVVIVGAHNLPEGRGGEGMQAQAINDLHERYPDIPIIAMLRLDAPGGGILWSMLEAVTDLIEIEDALSVSYDDLIASVSMDTLLLREALGKVRIRGLEGRPELGRKGFAGVICQVRGDKVVEVPEEQIRSAEGTMDEFARIYNPHMILTGHYDAMYEAHRELAIACPGVMGTRMVELGCGTAYPIWKVINGIMMPQFIAKARSDSMLMEGRMGPEEHELLSHHFRDPTSILLVDRSVNMLSQARDLLSTRIGEREWLSDHLKVDFLGSDIFDLSPHVLSQAGYGDLHSARISMLVHWQPDERKKAFVESLVGLIPKGAVLITTEEWPQSINPTPYMGMELMESIERDLRPIHPDDYYKLIIDAGMSAIPSGFTKRNIDGRHDYWVCAFRKD